MKKYIRYITFAAGMFYACNSNAQTTVYCILNDVATHCPGVIQPPVVSGIVGQQQGVENSINYNVPYDMQNMSSGYNISTPAVPSSSSINGVSNGSNSREIVARRKAYSGASAAGTNGINSNVGSVYPNPVVAATRITLTTLTSSPVSVDILDLNGSILRTFEYAAGIYNLDVDMSGLPQGMYSVRVYGKEIPMENLKVLKQ